MPSTPVKSAAQLTPVSSASLVPSSKETSSKKKREREDVRSLLQEGLSPSKKSKRVKPSSSPAQTRSKTRRKIRFKSKNVSSILPGSVFPEMLKFKQDGGHKIQIRIIGLFYTEEGVKFKTLLEFAENSNVCCMAKLDGKPKELNCSYGGDHIEEIIARGQNRKQIQDAMDSIRTEELKKTCMGLRVVMSENPCGNPNNRCVFSVVEKFPLIFCFDQWGLSSDQVHVVSLSALREKSGWISYKELNEIVESEKNSQKKDSFDPLLYNDMGIDWQIHNPINIMIPNGHYFLSWELVPDISPNQQQAQVAAP